METWPPQFQDLINEENFGVTLGNTTVRSEVDAGPPKVRSRFTDGIDQYTTSIYLDYDDIGDLLNFYKVTLANGSLTFGFNDPFTGVLTEYRFLEPPQISPRGGRTFTVNMKWERMT